MSLPFGRKDEKNGAKIEPWHRVTKAEFERLYALPLIEWHQTV